jgi:protein O-GlcNAc transferase
MTEKMAHKKGKFRPEGQRDIVNRNQTETELARAIQYHELGHFKEAEICYRRILKIDPENPDALHLMGVIAHQMKRYDLAADLIGRAIVNNPRIPYFHNNFGVTLSALKRPREAIESFQRALNIKPDFAEANNNLGNTLRDCGRFNDAILAFKRAIQLRPDFAEAYFNLGKALADCGCLDEAIRNYREALRLRPDYEEAHNNLGNALREKGQLEEAIMNYQEALNRNPEYIGALNNLANALRYKGKLDEAIKNLQRAIKINPDSAESYCNLGNALKDQHRFEAAIENYKRAIQLKPDFAEAHFNLSIVLLLLANFSEGWREFEWRLQMFDKKSGYPNRYGLPYWNGSPLKGKKIFVYDEQGLGDTLQFVRFIPQLKALGATVIFETRQSLTTLLLDFPWIDELVERSHCGEPAIKCDYCVSLLSLPGIFETTIDSIPARVPYLHALPQKAEYWRSKLSEGDFSVGIVWAGSPGHRDDRNRSLRLEHFEPFAKIPGISLVGLQKGDARAQGERLAGRLFVKNLGEEFRDFTDTAGVIENLDLLISIDTSVAHLAGAMGKPVWVLLPFIPDWRWLLGRKDTPWYPTMQLFRQTNRENWDDVIARAAEKLRCLTENQSKSFTAQHYFDLGDKFHDQGDLEKASILYEKALKVEPDFSEAYFNLGKIFQDQGSYQKAVSCYLKLLHLKPDSYEAYYNMGLIFQSEGRHNEAISYYQKALILSPGIPEAYNNMGNAFQAQGKAVEAISCYKKALELKPHYAQAYYNMGRTHYEQKDYDEAIFCYQNALRLKPDYAEAYHNLGKAYYDQVDFEKAISCYNKALKVKPDYILAYYNLAHIYRDKEDYDGVISCYNKAIEIKPDSPEAYHNLCAAYREKNKLDEAISACQKALQLKPDFPDSVSYLVRLLQHTCDWRSIDSLSHKLDDLTKKALDKGQKTAEPPMLSLRRHADPAINLSVAKSWSRHIHRSVSNSGIDFSFDNRRSLKGRVTVGYLSNAFNDNVVAHLIHGLFKLHNRDKFQILCYSSGKDDGSHYRSQIEKGCDKFIDISRLNDTDAAECLYEDQVDILVDLMGHTKGNRLGICTLRPVPIQVTYLGFLGSTGADFIDYFITDKIVTPKQYAAYYSEKLVYLPNCYQVNDHTQMISEGPWNRLDFGLPEHGFVFCSFNQPYKIEPVMFATWMKILSHVPNSVLWLLRQNNSAERNLKKEAEAVAIDPARIVFADAMPLREHLGRLRLADLALDTRIYNGGATTSNALWSGVPVITLQGSHFVSRMTSSSLSAIGLPDLITRTMEEYESLAIRLARDPEALKSIRRRLAENRLTHPLFDTPRFTFNLEEAYRMMWEIFIAGERPHQIEVQEIPHYPH